MRSSPDRHIDGYTYLKKFHKLDNTLQERHFLVDNVISMSNNLEYDLRSTEWVAEKVVASEQYAQHLYAALCNNSFVQSDIIDILKEKYWCCSWRYAGGIIADITQKGDYADWYCSGFWDQDLVDKSVFVREGVVTAEIREDLKKLGWFVISN